VESDADRAHRYRARAEQIRKRAQSLSDPAARETLITLAKEYDSLAASCDERKPRRVSG